MPFFPGTGKTYNIGVRKSLIQKHNGMKRRKRMKKKLLKLTAIIMLFATMMCVSGAAFAATNIGGSATGGTVAFRVVTDGTVFSADRAQIVLKQTKGSFHRCIHGKTTSYYDTKVEYGYENYTVRVQKFLTIGSQNSSQIGSTKVYHWERTEKFYLNLEKGYTYRITVTPNPLLDSRLLTPTFRWINAPRWNVYNMTGITSSKLN